MRMRRQKEVQRENDYYFDFLRMALPPGQLREEAFNAKPSPKPCEYLSVLIDLVLPKMSLEELRSAIHTAAKLFRSGGQNL